MMTGFKKRILLIDQDVTSNRNIRLQGQSSAVWEVCGEVTHPHQLSFALSSLKPEVVLVGTLPGVDTEFICQQIRYHTPHLTCLAIAAHGETWEPVVKGMGIWVLRKPISGPQLDSYMHQLAVLFPPQDVIASAPFVPLQPLFVAERQENAPVFPVPKRPPLILTVYGPKGGVGKTFVSRELAAFFASQSMDGRPLRVLAVDFNLDLGTFATSLNLSRTPNIYHWAQAIDEQLRLYVTAKGMDPRTLTQEEWHDAGSHLPLRTGDIQSFIVKYPESPLHVLTSPRDIRHSFDIMDYHIAIMLQTLLESDYDIILIDTAPDTTDATIQAIFFAQKVVVVGNPVIDSIENIQRMLKLLREAEYPEEKMQICINRMHRRESFTLEEIRAYFQLPSTHTIWTIPDDPEVKRSLNAGTPLMLTDSRTPAKDALIRLAYHLAPHLCQESNTETYGQRRNATESLIQRWFQRKR